MILHEGELYAVDHRFESKVAETVQQAHAQQYMPSSSSERPSLITELPLNGVAVVNLRGVVMRGPSWWSASWQTLIADLEFLESRPSVTAVMIVIDSAGGSAMGCQEACDVVEKMTKPVVAYINGYGCSAAYRFACHCKQIFATKSAQIGSIGTSLTVRDRSKQYAEMGVEVVAATTGPFKAFGAEGLPVTQEHRQFMEERVAIEQAGFVASLTVRGLTPEQQAAVSDGRYWSAEEALQLGLIDGVKSVTEVTDGSVLLVQTSALGVEIDDDETDVNQSLSAGQDEGSELVSGSTGQPAAKTGEVQTISIAEIRQLCPDAKPEFILQQAEIADNTAIKVVQAFAAVQAKQIADLQAAQTQQAAQQSAEEQQRVAQTLGTLPVGSQTLTQSVAGDNAGKGVGGDVIQQFESLVEDGVKNGLARPQALQTAIAESPELYTQYRQAFQKMDAEQKESRRLRSLQVSRDFAPAG